ncbi:ABC-2 type transport system permease protein [Kribbella orskensis]|uniref:ABC-2 type transport system permease protein n=1 Tax=Kribbella orskensis TaxID=2512216 RepID=A0ABY2BGH5_9ACTN|nr:MULTISPECIES: ABC transporter permease [Kribbella]TCN38002.1 ABC-2 type transport system permease protein [Kribbella sp. VKM Ac-2500]TCO19489.1 ABC-2 type transport system permease protein [Kribbella orskensis]
MSTTYAPRPGSAPWPRKVFSHAVMEFRLLLRNGEQLLLALVIPLGLLFLLGGTGLGDRLPLGDGPAVDLAVPRVLALAVLSSSFTSLAIATGFERRYGVIKRLGASPLSRTGLLAGKIGSVLAIELIQLAVLIGAGFALGWNPVGGVAAVFGVILMVLCGTAAFASLGLLMAGVLRAEATLAAANLLYLLLLVGGAIMTPVEEYPEGMQGVVRLLPSAALADGLANSTVEGVVPWAAALSLALWAGVLGYLVSRTFRWD